VLCQIRFPAVDLWKIDPFKLFIDVPSTKFDCFQNLHWRLQNDKRECAVDENPDAWGLSNVWVCIGHKARDARAHPAAPGAGVLPQTALLMYLKNRP
jgi:hypothetical protein